MPTTNDTLSFCRSADRAILRIAGSGNAMVAPAVTRCADALRAGGVKSLALDLSQCTHMDSTFLGTLLALHRLALRSPDGGAFIVGNPSPQAMAELTHTALHKVLHVAEVGPLDAPWSPVPCAAPEVDAFKRHVVDAHQALACLPGEAGAAFRKVAAKLTEEMDADRQ